MISLDALKSVRGIFVAIAVSGLALALAGAASAQTPLYWDPTFTGGTAGGGSGTWSTSGTNWWSVSSSSDVAWGGASYDAYFGGPAGTVTIPATPTPTANNLYFNTSEYTLAGGALNLSGGTVTVQPGDVATTANLLNIQNNYSVQGGGTLVLAGPPGPPGAIRTPSQRPTQP